MAQLAFLGSASLPTRSLSGEATVQSAWLWWVTGSCSCLEVNSLHFLQSSRARHLRLLRFACRLRTGEIAMLRLIFSMISFKPGEHEIDVFVVVFTAVVVGARVSQR